MVLQHPASIRATWKDDVRTPRVPGSPGHGYSAVNQPAPNPGSPGEHLLLENAIRWRTGALLTPPALFLSPFAPLLFFPPPVSALVSYIPYFILVFLC